jgi:NADH-quinone oxidoreductase subunit H
MKFGWKVLIPSSLAWILVVATLRALSANGAPTTVTAIFAGSVVLIVMGLTTLWDRAKEAAKVQPELDLPAPNFPVPKIPTANDAEVR